MVLSGVREMQILGGGVAQVACSPGTYANGTGNTVCTSCAAGSASNAQHAQYCPLCSSGHFASGTGNVGVVGGLVECLSVCCVL